MLQQYFSVKSLALKYDVERRVIYDAYWRGDLAGEKIGRLLRFSESAVEAWLTRHRRHRIT